MAPCTSPTTSCRVLPCRSATTNVPAATRKQPATVYLNGTDLEYGARRRRHIASGNNAFVQIQSQNATACSEYGGFYVGNNGGVDFFQLNSTVPSPATLNGLVVRHRRHHEDQELRRHAEIQLRLWQRLQLRTGGGLGTYGNVSLRQLQERHGDLHGCHRRHVIKGSNARDLSLSK